MNEKFFDLKKEKQDRMINAALKVFAKNGYGHASTDDIVREAGISKGLLFHYFISKLGLYSFVYDYSVRYMILELTTGVDRQETDFFELIVQIKEAELQVMKTYPYMLLFLKSSLWENVSEALVETEEKRTILPEKYAEILQRADVHEIERQCNVQHLVQMIDFTAEGLMRKQFAEEAFQPELYHEDFMQYLKTLKQLTKKEQGGI